MIDLHTHSTASDGLLSPSELLRYAGSRGVTVLALTDHDTLSGLAEAEAEAKRLSLAFIPGVELSVDFSPGTFHMLGYFLDARDRGLASALADLREGRDERNSAILRKLSALGLPLMPEDVAFFAGGESTGRMHIALAMVRKGYAAATDEAFERWLGKGKPAYVGRRRFTPENAVSLIRSADGVAVLAHPQTLGVGESELSDLMGNLARAGLSGVEAFYYSHSPEETALYRALAEKHGLVVTGGTDFHGGGLHGSDIGVGRGDMDIPEEVFRHLARVHRTLRPNP